MLFGRPIFLWNQAVLAVLASTAFLLQVALTKFLASGCFVKADDARTRWKLQARKNWFPALSPMVQHGLATE